MKGINMKKQILELIQIKQKQWDALEAMKNLKYIQIKQIKSEIEKIDALINENSEMIERLYKKVLNSEK